MLNIIVDSNYLAHRAMYKLSGLSHGEKSTGIIFGFLNSIFTIAKRFDSSNFVFCWDSTTSYRKAVCPTYKANRDKIITEDESFDKSLFYSQFDELRESILPQLGFENNFMQEGIEADDLIAKVVQDYCFSDKSWIIVSSDNDLWQLLHYVAGIYQPDKKKMFLQTDFFNEYGIHPIKWLEVKAIAGDMTDNLPGLKNIGVKTAIKIIRNQPVSIKVRNTYSANQKLIEFNKSMMVIPHEKTEPEILIESKFNFDGFDKVCYQNGLNYFQRKENFIQWRNLFGERNA